MCSAESMLPRSASTLDQSSASCPKRAVPSQAPHSELAAPFLIRVHECLMDAERWVAGYSAITETILVQIRKRLMARVDEELSSVC